MCPLGQSTIPAAPTPTAATSGSSCLGVAAAGLPPRILRHRGRGRAAVEATGMIGEGIERRCGGRDGPLKNDLVVVVALDDEAEVSLSAAGIPGAGGVGVVHL